MKKNYKSFIIFSVFLIIVFFLINQNNVNVIDDNIGYIKIAGKNIKVELADTREELIQGLSGRPRLGSGEGMLFIFENPGKYPFWMKAMNFSVDMIWINESMKVVYIAKDVSPDSFPKMYGPKEDAKYVLEVLAGFSEKNNLKEGDTVEF